MPGGPVKLDGSPLTINQVVAVAREGASVSIGDGAADRMATSRSTIEQAAAGSEAVYGINTGFGALSREQIDPESNRHLQLNLIRSHAAGVGDPLPTETVRAMLLILAGSLARGCSGVRLELLQQIIGLLNAGIAPVVPELGSVGASGDLAPLSHAALVLVGEGEAVVDGKCVSGADALSQAGMQPIALEAKEGLALINGTHLMAAQATLCLADIDHLMNATITAAAMAVDACLGTDATLDARIHEIRCQPGQIEVARRMRELLAGSTIVTSHVEDDPRVQDPYSLRATPQVLGAVVDSIAAARTVVERELGAVTDNPLVFGDEIRSGGNFHGMPLAIAMDSIAIALASAAGISERRVFWLQAAHDAFNRVPTHLSPEPGLHSGLMITQYTAAACCNELRILATPASVGNIPTAAGIEDYNSMGATSGLKLRRAVSIARKVIAIELLTMSEAIEHHRPLASGSGVEAAHAVIREVVPELTEDRPPAPDIEAIDGLIRSGALS
ncbi:MAG: histidine ammonia-lyase [Phycisphaerales bacterium]|nr:histidine ammonia-lyase [Phycisphaerales bacterium]